jgi:hypothetical protein
VALTQKWSAPVDATAAKMNTDSIPVVSATSDITGGIGPYSGQIIFNTTDNMLYRYDGTQWVAFLATGGATAATMHESRYQQTVAQSCGTGVDTKLNFNSATYSCNDVTASGASNTDFALNRGGVWLITVSMRWLGNAGGGERHLFLSTGTVLGTLANRFAGSTSGNVGTGPVSQSVASILRVGAGTSVFAGGFQNCGAALNTDVAFGGSNHISLTWLRPL